MPITEALVEGVEGWTDALPFTLKADGTGIALTGLTVRVYLKDNRGALVQNGTTGVLTVSSTTPVSSTEGGVEYTPASTSELRASRTPYKIRFQVTDVTSAAVYFPNEDEDLIKVNAV